MDRSIQVGDFVTSYCAGYWQVMELIPKYADCDYASETVCYKKGDLLGQWAITKKAFTPKMKPSILWDYLDAGWLKPVSPEKLAEIQEYFRDHPDFLEKYENNPRKLNPSIINCWLQLTDDQAADFSVKLETLPEKFTARQVFERFPQYKPCVQKGPGNYLLNLLGWPWELDAAFEILCHGWDLQPLAPHQ